LLNFPRAPGKSPGSRSSIGSLVIVRVSFRFAACCGVARDGVSNLKAEDRVSTFGITVLRDVFPVFLVSIFLRFGPRRTSDEIKRAGIRGPGKGVDFLFSFRDRKSFATIRRDQIELGGIILLGGVFFLAIGRFTF